MAVIDQMYRQRKFTLAMIFTLASVVALFVERMDGAQFIAMAGVVLALYGAANVAQKAATK